MLQPSSETTEDLFVESLVTAAPLARGVKVVALSVSGGGDPVAFRLAIESAGMTVHSLIEGRVHVATGEAPPDALRFIDNALGVRRVSAPRDIAPELEVSGPRVRVPGSAGQPGRGAIVAVIDSGIDWQHPDFVNGNQSRIRWLWDQAATSPHGNVPYGAEWSGPELDAALASANPALAVPHTDGHGHGTHVAGTAAGHDSTYGGVASSADLIVVRLGRHAPSVGGGPASSDTLGRSTDALNAFDYVRRKAADAGLPVAINFSQGTNGGGHSGESPLEIALDSLAQTPGVAVVKSAGNEQRWRTHASGSVSDGTEQVRRIRCGQGVVSLGIVELWYDGDDDLEVGVRPPGALAPTFVTRAAAPQPVFAGTSAVTVEHDVDVDGTGDNVFTLFFLPTQGAPLLPGDWEVHVRGGAAVAHGRFDLWIERAGRGGPNPQQLRFVAGDEDPTMTLSIPGTARSVVTVGSTVTRPSPPGSAIVGEVSAFSSRGPTRYRLQKPDLCAPGEWIIAARTGVQGGTPHAQMAGTSMAAPHVAGAAAILLSGHPHLTGEQVRQVLRRSAAPLPQSPDPASGHGELRVDDAVALASRAAWPVVSHVVVHGTTVELDTDLDCTVTLELGRHLDRLLLGRRDASVSSMQAARHHTFDLAGQPAGDHHVVIRAYSQDGWLTRDDNGGAGWTVRVP